MKAPEQALTTVDYERQKQLGMQAFRQVIAQGKHPGYPSERLIVEHAQSLNLSNLPRGPWDTKRIEEVDDTYQIHPWAEEMVTDPDVGIVTGIGEYWHFGPNATADPIIMRYDDGPQVLLIKRKDTGRWALPGGYVDPGETALEAAVREAKEETNINLGRLAAHAVLIYDGPVADSRTTVHAWPHTSAYRFDIFNESYVPSLELTAGDDAEDAKWFPLNRVKDLHGSHGQLIKLAVEDVY